MIQEVSNVVEDISFFEALALTVRQAQAEDPQLKVQAEIIRRANQRLFEEREKARKAKDGVKVALLKLINPLKADVLSRALNGTDKISNDTLWKIGLALDWDEETIDWLEDLRKKEDYRHHSTTQQRIAIVKKGGTMKKGGERPFTTDEEDVPDWVR